MEQLTKPMSTGAKLYMEMERDLRKECDRMVEDGECTQDEADFRFLMVRDEILEDMPEELFSRFD